MPAGTILVIDDEAASREACEQAVRAAGFKAVACASGGAAVEWLQRDPALCARVALAIVDYQMPGLNGLETYRRLRRLSPDLAGILVAGNRSLLVAVEALNLGFGQVLTKPVADDAVHEALAAVLAERRANLEHDRLQTLMRLYHALDELAGLTDRAALYDAGLRLAASHTAAQRVSLMTLDQPGENLRVVAALGLPTRYLPQAVCPIGAPVSGWVYSHGVPLELGLAKPVPDVIAASLRRPEVAASVCLPLTAGSEPLGVLNLSRLGAAGDFPPGAVEVAAVLADDLARNLQRLAALDRRAAQERVETVGRLASTLIHDLRGPVSIIAGAVEMLEDAPAPPAAQLEAIGHQIQALDRTCDQLLSFARNQSELAIETHNAAAWLGEIAAHCAEALAMTQVELVIAAEPGLTVDLSKAEMTPAVGEVVAALAETRPAGEVVRLTMAAHGAGVELRLGAGAVTGAARPTGALAGPAAEIALALAWLRHQTVRHRGLLEVRDADHTWPIRLQLPEQAKVAETTQCALARTDFSVL